MKSKNSPITLQAIAKLIDQKFKVNNGPIFARFDAIDKQFKTINTSIVGIYGEIDGVKQQIVGLDYKIDNLEKKVDKNFNIVFEGLTNLGSTLDLDHEKRIKRLENKVFAN